VITFVVSLLILMIGRLQREMGKSVDVGTYVRNVPDTWDDHTDFHDYMNMVCKFTKEQSIEYAKKYRLFGITCGN